MNRVAIVIVTWNSEREIGPCLDAARQWAAEIVVVDNASGDGTQREVRQREVRLIANAANRGFAAAVNQGIASLTAEFVLLLNPDAVLLGPIEPLCRVCERPRAAAAGGKLLDPAGRAQRGFMVRRLPTPAALAFEALLLNRLWPRNPVNWHYRCFDLNPENSAKVEQPAGAFLMLRREVWQELGGFDEEFYPVWFEDVDFCKRLRDRGYDVFYEPASVAKHTGGHSIRKISVEIREFYWYRSLLKYASRHFGRIARVGVCVAVMVGSILRIPLALARHRNWKITSVYGRIIRLAGQHLIDAWRGNVEVLSRPGF